MGGFLVFMVLTAAMGLSIFLSLPVVYSKRAQGRWAVGLNAVAIGILIFLLADVFSDVSTILYPSGYVANLGYSIAFGVAFVGAFLALYLVDNLKGLGLISRRKVLPSATPPTDNGPSTTALIIALGIGLQNLTEGLVFGVNWTAGALGILAVVFVGFFLQNVTEGFPIASPFLATDARRRLPTMLGLFLIGGLPTIAGGAIGYFWSNDLFLVVFDALAIGAIAYVILPMLRVAFRPLESREASMRRNQLVYLGAMIGFALGFAVNAI